jgi:hypothetical protein
MMDFGTQYWTGISTFSEHTMKVAKTAFSVSTFLCTILYRVSAALLASRNSATSVQYPLSRSSIS